jgi:predicted dehydrogenase
LDSLFQPSAISRRKFLVCSATLIGSFMVVPRFVAAGSRGVGPNEKLNIGCVGVGGRGGDNLQSVSSENIVALCDVDKRRAAKAFEQFPKAQVFQDCRRMLDQVGKTLDAVVVSTPDHTHAVAVLAALRMGKHVYCEKPMAHSIQEVRAMMKAARECKVVTQLGNQGHSYDSIRTFCEWIWDGAIGNVHTVHAGCGSVYSKIKDLPRLKETHQVPPEWDWDAWLGPVQFRPYHPMYLPGSWRGWSAFGTGVIGDWVCHVVDPVFWALNLGAPRTIQAQAEGFDTKEHIETFPMGSVVNYEFPARGNRGPVKLVWHDGTAKLPRPDDIEADDKVPGTGAVVLGDKGTIIYGSHGAGGVRIVPDAKMNAYSKPAKSLPRVPGHHEDWLKTIKTGGKAGSDFSYGGPLTEIALLGAIAIRLLGQKLEWDGERMRFTTPAEANRFLQFPYRKGWKL